jgi:hypothetical protein
MKPTVLLIAASLMSAASGALAQGQGDSCSNQYGACMDRCSSRPQSLQEPCSNTCEATTNQCYQGMYGPGPQNGQASVPQASVPQASVSSSPAAEPEARDAHGEATRR